MTPHVTSAGPYMREDTRVRCLYRCHWVWGGHAGVTRGQEPPSPPATSTHVRVHRCIYIYICIYIYTYIYTLQAHPCAEAAAGAPQACAPRAHTCPCTHTSAHVCPRMQVHPRPPLHARHRCAPHRCAWTPQHLHGGCLGAPQSHNPPSKRVGAEGGPPSPRGHQPKSVSPWGPLSGTHPVPPPAGVGGPPASCTRAETPWGGWATREELWVQYGVFFLIKI